MPDEATNKAAQDQTPTTERAGEDVRRRGWFWHWNSIITQFAPLIGLKGVGLLNSYTVWTDRREESPTRGYAFPSQQSEADFYGEDRAELITINKILVALDLIEIRKEMVERVDERGRRWRVPHNLYRVKDHPEGFVLTPEDVLRVAELAGRDAAVYRYVRRIFSSRFAPIDRDNVWHQILPIVREQETWQRLAARVQREEARASARTKAGHASRARAAGGRAKSRKSDVDSNDSKRDSEQTSVAPGNNGLATAAKADVAPTNTGSEIDVEPTNSGLPLDVGPGNNGLPSSGPTSAARANNGAEEVVDESNSTYNQVRSTTTTTTTGQIAGSSLGLGAGPDHPDAAGPLPEPSAAVLLCFEAANDRDATPLERELLAELEATFHGAAAAVGATGGEWVAAAIREAVSSGSRFVAPKRIREILNRWAARGADPVRPRAAAATPVVPTAPRPDVALPRGQRGTAVWERTLRLLRQTMDDAAMERFFAGSGITGYRGGVVTIEVASADAAEALSGAYYDLLARKLGEAMGRSVRLKIQGPVEDGSDAPAVARGDSPAPATAPTPPPAPAPAPPALPRFVLPGGLTNLQVWAAAQDELARRVTPANFEAWIRTATLIGRTEDGALVLGAPNAFAQRRLQPLLPEIQRVLSDILGPTEVRVVVAHDWLRLNARPDEE